MIVQKSHLTLCDDDGVIEFNGNTYTPDSAKGYFRFSVSHAFPVKTVYGTALHPAVIAANYRKLIHQNVNYEHQIREYHKATNENAQDRVIGSVLDATFPAAPAGGWKINADPAQAPGIEGIGVFFKATNGMHRLFGEHSTGRKTYTVSMEVNWSFDSDCGFALTLKPKAPGKGGGFQDPLFDTSPPDFLAAGYEYVPFDKAPDELKATFSTKKSRIISHYAGRDVTILTGGLNNQVDYIGLGIVNFGAESAAKLRRMTASAPEPAGFLEAAYARKLEDEARMAVAVRKLGVI
jgi:hypothetical protein